jgi:hypothetical protein
MWGFTVDDALISVRYARHLAAGLGYRFNAGGPVTDGVTPLPWPFLLATVARAEPLVVLERAKVFGFVVSAAGGGWLGVVIGRVRSSGLAVRLVPLLTLGLCLPMAAYAVSGMETALATFLATASALTSRRPLLAATFAGWAASLRPELCPWSIALAVGSAIAEGQRTWRRFAAGAVAVAPFAACTALRVAVWGHPAPLALLAKPSGVAFGLPYAGAGAFVILLPILVVAPWSLRRSPGAAIIVLAAIVHACSIVAVGGDWMPYARLWVPVVPSLAFAAALIGAEARPLSRAIRSMCALGVGLALVVRNGTTGRRVGFDRAALIIAARPWLEPLRRVAVLDIGWASAATEADIIDLAGLTDPEIAALPGGHTSKRVGAMFLLGRQPDAILLFTSAGLPDGRLQAWRDAVFGRLVEARLAGDDVIARHFSPVTWLPLGGLGAGYVLLRMNPGGGPPPLDFVPNRPAAF